MYEMILSMLTFFQTAITTAADGITRQQLSGIHTNTGNLHSMTQGE